MTVVGYVEAMTDTAALGWVWSPGRPTPLEVELRHGDTVLAKALADTPRDDLARSGIGTGHHAFALPIPDTMRPHLAELRVIAHGPDGTETPLAPPSAPADTTAQLEKLAQGLNMVIGSQRVLHRTLQATLVPPQNIPTDPGPAHACLQEGIDTLELFVVRLETALAEARPRPAPTLNWPLAATATLSLLALFASATALFRSLP